MEVRRLPGVRARREMIPSPAKDTTGRQRQCGVEVWVCIRYVLDLTKWKEGHVCSVMCARKPASRPRRSASASCAAWVSAWITPVSYTHLRAHETRHDLVCRLL